MSEQMLREFRIHQGATYYDGKPNHLIGPCECILTNERFIIKDTRGGTRQILLRDINTIKPHLGLVNKSLDLKMGQFAAIHIYGDKAQLLDISAMLNDAISSQFAPTPNTAEQSNADARTGTATWKQPGEGPRQVADKGFVTTRVSFGILGGGIISLLLSYLTAIAFLWSLGILLVIIWVTIQLIHVIGHRRRS